MPLQLRPFLIGLVACAATSSALFAQTTQATNLTVAHRDGQTFVVWDEATVVPAPESYRVYSWINRIQTPVDLAKATLVAEVPSGTWWNPRSKRAYVLKSNGPALTKGRGYLVVTTAAGKTTYYAVTAVKSKVENTKITSSPGGNSYTGVFETPKPTVPVLQFMLNGGRELYFVHFVPEIDVGQRKAQHNRPGKASDYKVFLEPTSKTPRPVVFAMHARKGTFDLPRLPWLSPEFIQVSVDDSNPPGIHSMWFGFNENFGNGPAKGKVIDYTERRILWTVDQILADKALAVDKGRVYAFGASFGAMSAIGLAVRYPDRFAAVAGVDPAFGITHAGFSFKSETDRLFGTKAQNLPSSLGAKIYDVFDYAREMQRVAKTGAAPMLFTMGRGDQVLGWSDKPAFFRAAHRFGHPGQFYWDYRGHASVGPWSSLEPKLFAELFQIRLDRPLVSFSSLSLDDDPGDGFWLNGDTTGTMGGYAYFDPATAQETKSQVTVDVGLKSDSSRLDHAIKPEARAHVTFRRLRAFKTTPYALYSVLVRNKGKTEIESQRIVAADADGVVMVPFLGLSRTTTRTVELKARPTTFPDLEFGGDRRIGGLLVLSLMGKKGLPAMLTIGSLEVNFQTVFGLWRIGDPLFIWGGFFGDRPLVEAYLPIPNVPAFRGAQLLGQALVGTKLTKLGKVRLR